MKSRQVRTDQRAPDMLKKSMFLMLGFQSSPTKRKPCAVAGTDARLVHSTNEFRE